MNKELIVFAVMLFTLGWTAGEVNSFLTDSQITDKPEAPNKQLDVQNLQGANSRDKLSPSSKITNNQINVFDDEVVLKISNAKWAVFTDTKSMDPVIDSSSKAIQTVPDSENEIHEGDIVAYQSKYEKGIITHRVIETGNDSKGWYAILKGDNNSYPDPEKVRFEQIQRVVVAIIY